jgi:hypothetical protein
MKFMLRLVALGTLALACSSCSKSGDAGASAGGGSASLADCRVVITRLYDLQGINTPDMAPTIEKQVNQCATGNSMNAQDVACVANAADMAQFGACGVTNKMGS